MRAICQVIGCGLMVNARGLCNTHYFQRYRARTHIELEKAHVQRAADACQRGHERSDENTRTTSAGGKLCRICIRLGNAERRYKLKTVILEHYGALCECCKETERRFLTIDHINDDGRFDRNRNMGGEAFYRSIIDRDFPDIYRILCMNCNWGRFHNGGMCPHEVLRQLKDTPLTWVELYKESVA
jgi:hypothetical protein